MPLITTSKEGLMPEDYGNTPQREFDKSPNRFVESILNRREGPGFFETAILSARKNSITGEMVNAIVPRIYDVFDDGYESDRVFNSYDANYRKAILEQYPEMEAYYKDGSAHGFTSAQQLFTFAARNRQDLDDRERLANGGFVPQMIGMFGADYVLGKGLAGLSVTKALYQATKGGGIAARAAKTAGLASAGNVAYEGALKAINPDRNVDTLDAMGNAAITAAVLGGSLSAALPLMSKAIGVVTPNGVRKKLAEGVEKAFVNAKLVEAKGMEAGEIDYLEDILREGPGKRGDLKIDAIRTSRTNPIISRIEEAWRKKGAKVEIRESADQPLASALDAMRELDDATKGNLAIASGPLGEFSKTMMSVLPASIRESPLPLTRFAMRLLFDDPTLTAEALKNPLTRQGYASAENLSMLYRAKAGQARMALKQALDEHMTLEKPPIEVTLSDGTVVKVSSSSDRLMFNQIVTDFRRQEEEIARGVRLKMTFDAPESVKKASEAQRAYYREAFDAADEGQMLEGRMALERAEHKLEEARVEERKTIAIIEKDKKKRATEGNAHSETELKSFEDEIRTAKEKTLEWEEKVQGLKAKVEDSENYMTQRWLRDTVQNNEEEFRRLLTEHMMNSRALDERGRPLTTSPKIDREVVKEIQNVEVRATVAKYGDEVTLRENDEAAYSIYNETMRNMYARGAERIFKKIIGAGNESGVQAVLFQGGSPLEERMLRFLDVGTFRKFLDNNADSILNFYDNQMTGRIASHLALNRAMPLINDMLEKLGHGRVFNGTPQQLLELVRMDGQRILTAAATSDRELGTNFATMIGRARSKTEAIVKAKIAELNGGSAVPGVNPAYEAGMRAWGRSIMRVTMQSRLGTMALTMLDDVLAHTTFYSSTEQRFKATSRFFSQMNEWSKRDLYQLQAGLDDEMYGRMLFMSELDQTPNDPNLSNSLFGWLGQKADYLTEKTGKVFFKYSGANVVNGTNKRIMAFKITQRFIDTADRMAKADKMMRMHGTSESAAMRAVGLTGERAKEAAILNQYGINGSTAHDIMLRIRQFGTGEGGESLHMIDADWDKYKGVVYGNYRNWRPEDRALLETWTSAINSELHNWVVEPKMLSRPLINQYFIGKFINQFQSFIFAWTNQRLNRMSHRTDAAQASFVLQMIAMGAVSDALHNHITGRRSLTETAAEWGSNPKGMLYAAAQKSPVQSWLARITSATDSTPIGIGRALGNNVSSTQAGQVQDVLLNAAPAADWATSVYKATAFPMLQGRLPTTQEIHTGRTALPFQNILPLMAVNRTAAMLGVPAVGGGYGFDPMFTRPWVDKQ